MARPTPDALAALGSLLGRGDYTDEAVRTRLYVDDTYIHPHESFVYNKRLGDDRLSELIRLFLLHDWLDLERARRALSGLDLDDLEGLLSREGGGVRSAVAVQPWRGLLVAHDWGGSDAAREHVIGASAITGLLADLTPRSRVGSALDVGTGSGSSGAVRVEARCSDHRDGSESTCATARRVGSRLERCARRGATRRRPVRAGRRTAIRPRRLESAVHRLSRQHVPVSRRSVAIRRRLAGDRRAGAAIPARRRIRTVFSIRAGSRTGRTGTSGPADGSKGAAATPGSSSCPAIATRVGYAVGWNRPLLEHDRAQFEATVDRWVRAFADSNTARIASGAIVLRKRSGSNWIRVDETRTYPAAQAGRHVEQLFAGQTLVAALPDDRDLLELVVSPYDGLRLDQTEAETPNGAELLAARLRIKDGVPLNPKVDAAMIEVVRQLDGRRPLRALLPDDGAATHALPTIRDLIGSGFLDARAGGGSHA